MREYERYEFGKEKCPTCGCRNKIHTELLDDFRGKHIGYTLKCCACGYQREYYNEHSNHGKPNFPRIKKGRQHCFMLTFCPHTDCPFHPEHGKCDRRKEDMSIRPMHDPERYTHEIVHSPHFL